MTVPFGLVVGRRCTVGWNKLGQKGSNLGQNRGIGTFGGSGGGQICAKLGRRGSSVGDRECWEPAIVVLEVDVKTFCLRTNVNEGEVFLGHV